MTRYLSRLLALVLVAVIGLTGCASANAMTGDYAKDTLSVVSSLRQAIDLPADAPDKAKAQAQARQQINDFISRYRRDGTVAGLSSYMTMQTALNGLAGHYSSYPNRPLPEKLKKRLEKEFRQVELAISRGA
jgi:photosystem II Psb27 protein